MTETESCAAAADDLDLRTARLVQSENGDFLAFRGVCNFSLGVIQGDVGRNCFKDASRCGTKQKAEIQTGYSSARCRALPRVSLPQCLRSQCHRASERTEALVVHG